MTDITLYKYEREGGGMTVSPVKPNCDFVISHRLVADDGNILQNEHGDICAVVDTDSVDDWIEIKGQSNDASSI